MPRYTWLLFLVFSLLIAAVYSLSVLREGRPAGAEKAEEEKYTSASVMDGVRVLGSRDGKRQWALVSDRIEITGDKAALMRVKAEVDGVNMLVDSEKGSYDMLEGGLRLEGDVRMKGLDYLMRTDEVFLDPESGEILTDGEVVIEGEGYTLKGLGLRADGIEIRLLADVRAVFY